MAKRKSINKPMEQETVSGINKILITKHRLKFKNKAQKGYSDLINNHEIVLSAGPAGVGKAQPLYSKILTPNGWTTMGEVKVGDKIIGSNGKPIKITHIHPQGEKEIHRVYFSDGSYTDCCDEHLWLTQTYDDRNYGIKKDGKRTHQPRNGSVKSLNDIMGTLHTTRGDINHSIPMVKPVEFEKQSVFIDPYIMGCLLGDGGLTQNRITFTTEDVEIVENISERLNENHTINKKTGTYAYSIIGENRNNLILNELDYLGLKNISTYDKYIPEKYKFTCIESRLEILQGLMDRDGYVNKKGTSVFFTNTSKQLIDDIGFIVNSLGGKYNISEKIGKYKNAKGVYVICKTAYTLTISLPPHINPFKLNRKANLVTPKTKYIPKRYITAVEPLGKIESQCITVDAVDSLYVTDDFIVTHNSYVAIARAIELLQNKTTKYDKMVILKPAVEADEKHGFLPGDMREKMEPYVSSSMDIVDKIIGEKNRNKLEEAGIIKVEALAYIRGKSIDGSILIMEEAQNMSPSQVKTLLTRIGENSKFIISGDLDQSDRYKDVTESGLYDAVNRHRHLDEIGYYEFGVEDIVRNPIITKILKNYDNTSSENGMLPSKIIKEQPRVQLPKVGTNKVKKLNEGVDNSKKVRTLKSKWVFLIRKFKKLLQ